MEIQIIMKFNIGGEKFLNVSKHFEVILLKLFLAPDTIVRQK